MNWRGWTAFVALGIIWGLPYFFIKLALQDVSPLILAFSRVVLAALILMPIAWHRGALRSLGNHKMAICAFGLVEFAIPFTLISIGERWISSSVTGILIAMVPLSIALIQRFFGIREALGKWRIFGLVVGFVGVAALLGTGSISGSLGWAGVGCMLLATICYAIGPLIIQRHLHGLDSIGPLAVSLLVAGLILFVPAAMARASVITYINPVVATLLGVLVLNEHLGIGGCIAFALILIGSWLATRGSLARSGSSSEATVSV